MLQARYAAQLSVQGLTQKLNQATQLLNAFTSVQDTAALCDMIRACTLALAAAQALL